MEILAKVSTGIDIPTPLGYISTENKFSICPGGQAYGTKNLTY
jgi:hypothetical protein